MSEVRGSTLADGNFFLFFGPFVFVFLFFRQTNFHFLTDLKHTGRLIAGSISAFISKIL